ncbi:MAG: hypothetical protein IPG01_11585 [Chitinophagaceae bacterium]|nr:hypothetical protein [Chitinophagaceae bacterium]
MNHNRLNPIDLFVGILAILLISVSFYQTWLGLQQIFGPASFIISLVLSSMLLMLCWLIRDAKLKGNSTTGLLTIYVFIASFCFMANFNALYTRFMRTDIYTTELREINENFNHLEADVNSKFNYKYNDEVKQNIEILKNQMIEQIKDPGNKGIGTRAQSLIRDIEKLLGQRVDLLTPVGNDYVDLAERMGSQIDAMITSLSPVETELKVDLNKAVLKWNKRIQELLLLSNAEKDDISQGLIDESLTEYNKLGNKALTILGANKIKFVPVLSKTQEVGKIGYAFEHALKNFGVYQFVVLMGCILLDFLIPILLLLITKPVDKNRSGSVFKREGKVLIPKN